MSAMRGLYLTDPGCLELREKAPVAPNREEVQIRVHYAGVCSTDVDYWKNGSSKLRLPVILGHEMSGVVTAVGDAACPFQPGDRVVVTNDYYLCGKCRYCLSGDTNMCVERRSIGSFADGAFADYMTVPSHMVLPLPLEVTMEEGALTEVAACGVHGLRQAHARTGALVLVLGPGIMGMTAALAAQAMGCTVVVAGLTRDGRRLEAARQMGLRHVVNSETADLAALISQLSDGYGADIACECTGSFSGLSQCLELTARRGCVIQIAIPHGAHGIDLSPVIRKELRYMGSYAKNTGDWKVTLDLMARHKMELRPLISAVLPLEDYAQAFERVSAAKDFKILFDLQK